MFGLRLARKVRRDVRREVRCEVRRDVRCDATNGYRLREVIPLQCRESAAGCPNRAFRDRIVLHVPMADTA